MSISGTITLECYSVNTKVLHLGDLIPPMEETVGQRLRRLRKEAGLTQSAIGNIEAGTRGYGASVVVIAKAVHQPP